MLASDVERFIKSIINEFDEQGRSFSEITLINPKFGDKTLYLELSILLSKRRNIDKIIVKGYEQFPQSFVRRYFNVRLGEKFTREKLQSLSLYSKSIDFDRKTIDLTMKSIDFDREFIGLHKKSIDFDRKPIDLIMKSFDFDRESIDLHKKSIDFDRKLIDLHKKSIDFDRKPIDLHKKSIEFAKKLL